MLVISLTKISFECVPYCADDIKSIKDQENSMDRKPQA